MTETELQRFYGKVWTTSRARFAASHRLRTHEKIASLAAAFCSVELIAVSLLPLSQIVELNPQKQNALAILGSVLSVAVLVLSILDAAERRGERSARHHDAGREINKLYDELKALGDAPAPAELAALRRQYHELLARYDDNHLPIDYQSVALREKRGTLLGEMHWVWFWLKSRILMLWPYVFALVGVPLLVFWLAWST